MDKGRKMLIFAVNPDCEVVICRGSSTEIWTVPTIDIVPEIAAEASTVLEEILGLIDAIFETPDLCVLVARQWKVSMEGDRNAKSIGVVNSEILKKMIDDPTNYGEVDPVVRSALVNFFAKKHNV